MEPLFQGTNKTEEKVCNQPTRKIWVWLLLISLAIISIYIVNVTNFRTVMQSVMQSVNQSISQSDRQLAKKHFRSVLFIVKYNYNVSLDQLKLHSSFWSTIFEHQLLMVPYDSFKLMSAILKVGNAGIKIISCLDDKNGYWAYKSIITAFGLYPHYDGYLYTHDDMALNITKLMSLDLQSYWITDYNPGDTYNTIWPNDFDSVWNLRNNTWFWLNLEVGIDAMQKALRKYPSFRQSLIRCTGHERRWFAGQSDFLYVPQHQKSVYIDIMRKLAEAKVFLEIAVPTFIACFAPKNIVEKIVLCTFWGDMRGNVSHMDINCPPSSSAYHPVKLSGQGNFKFMIRKTGLQFHNIYHDMD